MLMVGGCCCEAEVHHKEGKCLCDWGAAEHTPAHDAHDRGAPPAASCCSCALAELSELRDPKGAAQTALAMLRDRAPPERRLDEFVENKISGVQAVADAIAEMRGLAGSAELPRQARSAGTIVLLWLLLLLASVAWMLRRA